MTNAELIAALKRLIAGQQLSPQESVEVIALVIQNTKRPKLNQRNKPEGRVM